MFKITISSRMVILLGVFLSGIASTAGASVLVPQTPLPGDCIPQFAVQMPVSGPTGNVPRVDALNPEKLNCDQPVNCLLNPGDPCCQPFTITARNI